MESLTVEHDAAIGEDQDVGVESAVPSAERCAVVGAQALVCAGCPFFAMCQEAQSAPVEVSGVEIEPFDAADFGRDEFFALPTEEVSMSWSNQPTSPESIPGDTTTEAVSSAVAPEAQPQSHPSYLELLFDDSVPVVVAESLRSADAPPALLEEPKVEIGGGIDIPIADKPTASQEVDTTTISQEEVKECPHAVSVLESPRSAVIVLPLPIAPTESKVMQQVPHSVPVAEQSPRQVLVAVAADEVARNVQTVFVSAEPMRDDVRRKEQREVAPDTQVETIRKSQPSSRLATKPIDVMGDCEMIPTQVLHSSLLQPVFIKELPRSTSLQPDIPFVLSDEPSVHESVVPPMKETINVQIIRPAPLHKESVAVTPSELAFVAEPARPEPMPLREGDQNHTEQDNETEQVFATIQPAKRMPSGDEESSPKEHRVEEVTRPLPIEEATMTITRIEASEDASEDCDNEVYREEYSTVLDVDGSPYYRQPARMDTKEIPSQTTSQDVTIPIELSEEIDPERIQVLSSDSQVVQGGTIQYVRQLAMRALRLVFYSAVPTSEPMA